MRGLLRIILLVVNALVLAWVAYQYSTLGLPRGEDRLPVYAMTIFLVLNFVYLLPGNQLFNWRASRLIDLWFDAKENELHKRINRSRQDK
jgi:hypothetical protein